MKRIDITPTVQGFAGIAHVISRDVLNSFPDKNDINGSEAFNAYISSLENDTDDPDAIERVVSLAYVNGKSRIRKQLESLKDVVPFLYDMGWKWDGYTFSQYKPGYPIRLYEDGFVKGFFLFETEESDVVGAFIKEIGNDNRDLRFEDNELQKELEERRKA